ncbi:hypothetical protein IEQ34_010810 [Dendrobium chrysotoxum]|uniref:Uncharacterized protein n=1 Tax=Dendrobium chrysotoxum TaxID=161865 RepID=A0AAV7GVY7_DENCH|nr:hypothetical protein IEQ34_010810 [Dendrobium chrysotoxum]
MPIVDELRTSISNRINISQVKAFVVQESYRTTCNRRVAIEEIEKILDCMQCSENRKVSLAERLRDDGYDSSRRNFWEILLGQSSLLFLRLVCTPISLITNIGGFYKTEAGKYDSDAFLRGLKEELRYPLVPLRIQEFLELVERAKLRENDLAIQQFRQNMCRKRINA